MTGIISQYRSEGDLVVEWRISDFFTLSEEDGAWYCSPHFSIGGEKWFLWIFPNGSSGHHSSEHVDLCLWKCKSDRSMRLSFSLSLKTAKGEKYHEEHGTKDSDEGFDCHDFYRFIQRSELTMKSSELVPEGVLTVVCTMKSSPSAGSEKGETSNAEVNKSDVAEGSGSSQAGNTISKELVLKWIKENCEEASKEKKRKLEAENVLKWIKENCEEASKEIKRKLEAENVLKWFKENCEEASKEIKRKLEAENVLKWIEENCREESKGKKRKREEENNDGSLSQDFKKLLLEGLNHDLILKVGDKELRAHQDVLRARSNVFKSMLDHDMKEKNSGIIDVPDCDPLAMEQFLFYIYSGNIETLDQSNMFNLYYIADKYEMKGLVKKCSNFIGESLSQTNICDVIQLAVNHSDSSLLESTTVYFRNNMLGIMRTVEWQKFLKDNSTVANELLIKAVEKLSNVNS